MTIAPTLSTHATTHEIRPSNRVEAIKRWLAHQRAAPMQHVAGTAWSIVDEANKRPMTLEGKKAPLVVQERFSLWLIGQLGGPAHLRVFPEEADAVAKAGELGAEMQVPVLVIGAAGELAERVDPPATVAPTTPSPGAVVAEARTPPTLKVARHGDHWAVFLADRVIATAPTRERARQQARALRGDPDFNAR